MASYGETNKQDIIKKYQLHAKDEGSCEVQLALLTHRINYLVDHLKKHKKDHHTRNGLLAMVGRRKKLAKYLEKKDSEKFLALKKKLKLK